MSPPPRPHPLASTGREQTGDLYRLDYLPIEYAGLVALQEDLAGDLLRRTQPGAGSVDEGDVGRTLIELSALLGHVLAVYQRRYAGEAFISTAQAPSSLVRHARRLAYEPDTGLAAIGFAVLTAKPGQAGMIRAGFALASAPLGESAAQDYETRDDLLVDATLNAVEPAGARRPITLLNSTRTLRVEGIGHGLEPGEAVAFIGSPWERVIVGGIDEDAGAGVTIVHLAAQLDRGTHPIVASDPPRLLARPLLALRQFGADADPVLFPPAAVQTATSTQPTQENPRHWYAVTPGYSEQAVYLSEALAESLIDAYLLRLTGPDTQAVVRVTNQGEAAVTLHREEDRTFETHTVTIKPKDGGFTSELTPIKDPQSQKVANHLSRTVTALQLKDDTGPVARATLPMPAEWLTGWNVEAKLAHDEPNPDPLDLQKPLELAGLFGAIEPGRPLVFTDRAGTAAQAVVVRRAELDLAGDVTTIWWDALDPAPPGGWRLGDLVVLGNVVRVSHGRTVEETLGSSDGVTPFQRFALRQSPLTLLPGPDGAERELEVRVADVAWTLVDDFGASGPADGHYRVAIDEARVATVVFGDGRTGAVPPSGDRNLRAVYRIGLGVAGDLEPRRLSRIKRAHPLLDGVTNVTAISGGTEPAEAEAIRRQATLWIRTFDRAVSVQDLADLALLFGGIARASAWATPAGAVLIVATASGAAPPDLKAVGDFLDARRDATLPLEVRGPEERNVQVSVTVQPDPAYLPEIVDDAVRATLHGPGGLFTFAARDLGQPAYLSEVYERVEAVPGVVGAVVDRFEADAGGVNDVIEASLDKWLKLEPNDLIVNRTARLT